MTTRKEVKYISEDSCYVFECPHCDLLVQVKENDVNCQIFRHGLVATTKQQINPHASKEHCDRLVAQGLVIGGCAGPFKLFRGPTGAIEYVDICEYI